MWQSEIFDSPVSNILGTNVVPSESDKPVIRELIAQGKADLTQLDAEYARLQAASQQLLRDRSKLRTQIDAHESLLSPARRIPPELIATIFRHCLPQGSYPEPKTTSPPLLLCQICSGWREVAISTPELWAQISVREPVPNILLIEEWLHRSRALPLSFHVESYGPNWSRVLSVLLVHLNRWREAEFPTMFVSYIAKSALCSPPSLEALSLTIPMLSEEVIGQLHHFVNSSPVLRRMRLVLHAADWQALHFPWTRLTELVLRRWFNVDECLELLRQCTELVSITIDGIRTVPPPSLSTSQIYEPPMILPKLRKISISANKTLDTLFSSLCLPSLSNLAIRSNHTVTWSASQLHALLARSQCPLESLFLSGGEITEASLTECLRLTPSLQELSFRAGQYPEFTVTDELLRLLTYRKFDTGDSCLLPLLEVLKLNANCRCSHEVLVDMIESRWWTSDHASRAGKVARLRVVEVEPETPLDKDALRRLGKCREEGLEFPAWRDLLDVPYYI